jgi:hypothetical protein
MRTPTVGGVLEEACFLRMLLGTAESFPRWYVYMAFSQAAPNKIANSRNPHQELGACQDQLLHSCAKENPSRNRDLAALKRTPSQLHLSQCGGQVEELPIPPCSRPGGPRGIGALTRARGPNRLAFLHIWITISVASCGRQSGMRNSTAADELGRRPTNPCRNRSTIPVG